MKYTLSKKKLLFILLLIFFLPISTPGGISANYLYAVLFLICPFLPYRQMPLMAIMLLVISFLSYGLGYIFIADFGFNFAIRQTFSFIVFIVGVLLLLINIPYSLDDICRGVVIISVMYAILVVVTVVVYPQFSLSDPYLIKGGLREYVPHWPQRFTVIVGFGFFCAIVKMFSDWRYIVVAAGLIICLFLTFSRAIYLSVVIGVFALLVQLLLYPSALEIPNLRRKIVLYLGVAGIGLILVCMLNPAILTNVSNISLRTYNSIVNFGGGAHVMAAGSDSERMYFWSNIIKVWRDYPVLGTGFANIYLFNPKIGSAHNQYLDILLRTGLIGLVIYLSLWMKLFCTYWKRRPDIFSGLVMIFIFGFFHETTKLSYTGLLFFLLLNKAYEMDRCARMHKGA